MTITFSMTAREVVTLAMEDRMVLALGRDPSAKELAYGVKKLNLIIKDLASQGVTPWRDVETTVSFDPAESTVVLTPRPVDVLDAWLVNANGSRRPMTLWEKGEFRTLPNPAQTGTPIVYSLVHTATDVSMRIWPVPSVTAVIGYSYSRVMEDVTQESDPVDIPQMWLSGMVKMLATELKTFGDGGDPMHLTKIEQEAEIIKRRLLDHDRPSSYTLDYRCRD